MLKRILLSIVLVLITAYLVIAITAFSRRPQDEVCQALELVVKDSVYAGFITKKEAVDMLKKKGIDPIGKEWERIHTRTLERELAKHPLIDDVECYRTPSGKLFIEVSQRIPILRIMGDGGADYYLDNKGTIMPHTIKCAAHLAIVTGKVEKNFVIKGLYPFAMFLQQDPFWKAQIEQINIRADHTLELVPRVGEHLIYMGTLDQFERKLKRVKKFYEKGLNKVGWNKYSRISVEFGNQIICTKKND